MQIARIAQYVLLAGTLLWAGCRSQDISPAPVERLCRNNVTAGTAMQTAQEVLERMHFSIEKADLNSGIVRTRPLRGAQLFELWRSDNVGPFNTAEANLHTIRRTVELRLQADDGKVCIDCVVRVQRLSLPENEVASTAQAYRMYSQSTPSMQRLELNPQQRESMAWIDLGPDEHLAAEILKRIARRIGQPEAEQAK